MGATVFFESASETATLSNTFSVSGTPTDPTTVALVVTTPAGVATTYTYALAEVTKTGTGIYTKDIACTEDGTWQYVWTGTGSAADVVAGTWTVFGTELQRRYCSLEELKSRAGITGTGDDFEISLAIESASRWIDGYCDRRFWRGTDTRTYESRSLYCVDVDDLVSVTTLKTDASGDGTFETTWTTADYQLRPVNPNAAPEPRPYTSIRAVGSYTFPMVYGYTQRTDLVQVVGVFGWPASPLAVKQAALILSADLFKLKGAPFGVANFGDFAVRIRDNPRVTALLAPYRRHAVLMA